MLTLAAICKLIQAGMTPGELARMRQEEWERKQAMDDGELILQLLQSEDPCVVLTNLSNKRWLYKSEYLYCVNAPGKQKAVHLCKTDNLAEAIKWLKGKE